MAEKHFALVPERLSEADCEAKANDLPFLNSINQRLRSIKLECRIRLLDLRTWQYRFELIDLRRQKEILDINSLSAGQKAIIHLVFEAYGRGDLKGGVVLIDEPEIHLHYQFQNEYLKVIRDLNKDQQCQYILVTHSEALINSSTISNVRRFSLDDFGHTKICAPSLDADQKTLIRILDNTRSTYAFFARSVVLVEGDTDRYFFRSIILDYYPELDQDIAILHIGGKGEFKKWKALFSAFGLSVFLISDLDYLINLYFPTEKGKSLRTSNEIYNFKQRNPTWLTILQSEAENNTFILEEGPLEQYTGLPKDLSSLVNYCRTNLKGFLSDSSSSKSVEIRRIVEAISKQPFRI